MAEQRLRLKKVIVFFRVSEIIFQSELNYPRVIAGRDDLAEVAGVVDDASGVWVDRPAGLCDRVEVADGVGEIDIVEEIERFTADFDFL